MPDPAAPSDARPARRGRVLLGTQGWNYADWVGGFYPPGTRPADFLSTYARAFGAVEVDSTFYAIPPESAVRGWRERTPAGFVFCPKLPREATHERRLVGAAEVAEAFAERMAELGDGLGPALVQLPPDFGPRERGALEAFVPRLPAGMRWAVEVRRHEWMRGPVLRDLMALLEANGVALALSDGRWIPRETLLALAARPTAGFHYLRWMGPDRSIETFSRVVVDRSAELEAWAEALRPLPARGVDLFGFANNHFAGHSPDSIRRLQRLLGQSPVDPSEIGEQTSLF